MQLQMDLASLDLQKLALICAVLWTFESWVLLFKC